MLKKMNIAIILFDDFETLDVFGPVEVFGRLPEIFTMHYYSQNGGTVNSTQGVGISTRKIDEIGPDMDIVFIPGGQGTRTAVNNDELISAIKKLAEQARYAVTVCTGSALMAKTTLLDGRAATSNKMAFAWVESVRPEVKWKGRARWIVDGKYYTSSGVSAGIDMALGFVSDVVGVDAARKIAREIEYVWNSDPAKDPFFVEG